LTGRIPAGTCPFRSAFITASVVRLEGRIAIEELTQRYLALELAAPPTRRPLHVLRGFESVPVRATHMPAQSAA
jgi:hypothetical protein